MREMSILRAAVVLVFLLSASGLRAEQSGSVEHQGVARPYLMHLPQGKSGALPLVVYLHGLRSDDWHNHSWPELDATADREGFVATYPEAIKGRWNFSGQRDEKMKIGDEPADDIGFLAKLIDDLVSRGVADPKRVYAIGESRGSLMSFELMCRLADRIAAAGALISGMIAGQRDACAPSRAVPVFALAGTADPVQFYDGWLLPSGRLLSVPETMEFWRVRHGCTGQTLTELPHRLGDDTTRLTLIQWTGCTTENAVRLYRVDGGGHRVPSLRTAPEQEWEKKFGRQNHDIETIDTFWDFAKSFAIE